MRDKRLYPLSSLIITCFYMFAWDSAYAQTTTPAPAIAAPAVTQSPLQTLPNPSGAATPTPLPAITPLPTAAANPIPVATAVPAIPGAPPTLQPAPPASALSPSAVATTAIAPVTPPATPVAPPPAPSTGTPLAAIPAAPAVTSKLPDVLLVPTSANTTSMLFSKTDIDHLTPFIAVYESLKDNAVLPVEKDDLSSLLDTIKKGKDETTPPPPPPLPALYLGSIAYYTPGYWSVWLNGKKLLSTHNNLQNEFYVSQISRTSAEIVWKPFSLQNVPVIWKALSQNGAVKLPNVDVDVNKGTITMLMHTNQTFLPRSLAIREGLVKSINTGPGVATPATAGMPNLPPNLPPGMQPGLPGQPPKYQMPTLPK